MRTQFPDALDAVATGSATLPQAMEQIEQSMTAYAKNQGFTVTSG
jgi:hypothetical protein